MPRITGTTNAQTKFLRSFKSSPFGPPPSAWPSPSILRRWLRKPAFRDALDAITTTLRYQSDFHLAAATAQALNKLLAQDAHVKPQDCCALLRLSHLRERFAPKPPPPPPHPFMNRVGPVPFDARTNQIIKYHQTQIAQADGMTWEQLMASEDFIGLDPSEEDAERYKEVERQTNL
ncbi:MAG TPA: hypothetical protein VF669_04490 [Tepidisphaeraceae bacterium]|jgi:hypothetical protein